jgi:hypothetical protein
MYNCTLSLTSALDGGGVVVNSTPRQLYPQENQVTIVQEAGCSLGPVWMSEENLAPQRDSIP